MSRTAYFTKEEVAAAGLQIVRGQGFHALTARALGKQLNCSLSPIFTVFKDMEEIQSAVRSLALEKFSASVSDVFDYTLPFKEFGMRLIRFAKEEPDIFHMLFLDRETCINEIPPVLAECLKNLKQSFSMSESQLSVLFRQILTFTCGIAILARQTPEKYTDELISEMLTIQFSSTMSFLKSGCEIKTSTPCQNPSR